MVPGEDRAEAGVLHAHFNRDRPGNDLIITPLKSSTLSVIPMPSMMTVSPQVIHALPNQVNNAG